MTNLIRYVLLSIALLLTFVAIFYSPYSTKTLTSITNLYFYISLFLSIISIFYRHFAVFMAISNISLGIYFCFIVIFSPIVFIIYLLSSICYLIFWKIS